MRIHALILAAGLASATLLVANAETLYGIAFGGFLVSVDSTTPNTATYVDQVSALQSGQSICGITSDSGQINGLGVDSGIGAVGLYSLNLLSGYTSVIGSPSFNVSADPGNGDTFWVSLTYDSSLNIFNVVNYNGRTLTLNSTTGAVGTPLTYSDTGSTLMAIAASKNGTVYG